MAKAPRPGFVKTRLRLSDDTSAALAVCLLKDAYKVATEVTPNIVVAFAPADARAEFEELLPSGTSLHPQIDGDLGARMNAAFEFSESEGFSPVVMIGTDCPSLTPSVLSEAFAAFDEPKTEVVLGPASDGGYYLIALRRANAALFENVEWSTSETLAQTSENARRIYGSEAKLLEVLDDLDTPEDLEKLVANPEKLVFAPATARWLRERHT